MRNVKSRIHFLLFAICSVKVVFASSVPDSELAYGDFAELVVDHVQIWPDKAPHETDSSPGRYAAGEKDGIWRRYDVSQPELVIIKPKAANPRDTVVVVMPGGGYMLHGMGALGKCRPILDSGRWLAVLHYRVPQRKGRKMYEAPREDAARAIRHLRVKASHYGFSAEKIGAVGFSAGANLAAFTATSSEDELYVKVDALDDVSPHLNFAVLAYPAYVVGDGAAILPEFKFDSRTPPMFMIHGDRDSHSSMGSVLLYSELHKRNIPAQLFVFSNADHGLCGKAANVRGWQSRIVDWLDSIGY